MPVLSNMDPKVGKAALLLQHTQTTYNIDLHIPMFVLVGMQSAGKTRMLSVLAGLRIGGAERHGCGTRCPVHYLFALGETASCSIGKRNGEMTDTSVDQLYEKITGHMRQLEQQQTFSEEPLYVNISGPACPNVCIVDLPGVNTGADFEVITKLIRLYLAKPNVLPILMTSFHMTLDIDRTKHDVAPVLEACQDAPAMSRALVAVSMLDLVLQNLGNKSRKQKLHEMVGYLRERKFKEDRIYFLSLKPEMLNGHQLKPDVEDSAPSHVHTAYLRNIVELEKKTMPDFKTTIGVTMDDRLQFGIASVVEAIQKTLTDALRDNFRGIQSCLQQQWPELESSAEAMLGEMGDDKLKELVTEHMTLFTGILSGMATDDSSRILRYFNTARRKFPKNINEPLEKNSRSFLVNLNQTFKEEMVTMSQQGVFNDIFTSNLLDKMDPLHHLTHLREQRLSSGSSVKRLLGLYAYTLMKRDLESFSEEEIIRLAGFNNLDSVRGFDIESVVRKMVAEIRLPRQNIECIVTWCTSLYAVHAREASSIMRKHTSLLNNYPRLRDNLEQCLVEAYEGYFAELAREVTLIAEGIVEHRFRTLKLDEIMSVLRLLGCVGLTKSLLCSNDAPIAIDERDLVAEANDVAGAMGVQNIPIALLKFAKRVACSPNRHTHHTFDYFGECGAACAEDFAIGESLFLEALNGSDVRTHLDKINATVHMIHRFSCGLIHMELVALIEERVVCTVQQLEHTISSLMSKVITDLWNDEARLASFKGDDGPRLDALRETKGKLKLYIETMSALNGCEVMPHIDVSRPMDLLRRVEERDSVLQRNVELLRGAPQQPVPRIRIPVTVLDNVADERTRRLLDRVEALERMKSEQERGSGGAEHVQREREREQHFRIQRQYEELRREKERMAKSYEEQVRILINRTEEKEAEIHALQARITALEAQSPPGDGAQNSEDNNEEDEE